MIFTNQISENIQQVREEIAFEAQKYSTDMKPKQEFENESPLMEINNLPFSDPRKLDSRSVPRTQKQMVRQNINFMDNLDSRTLNQSIGDNLEAYNVQSPYNDFINQSQTLKSSTKNAKNNRSLWYPSNISNKPLINEKSKQIANSKKTCNIGVHERLHQHALSKQKIRQRNAQNGSLTLENERFDVTELNPISSMKSSQNGKSRRKNHSVNSVSKSMSSNYGSRLYQNGMKKLEEVDRRYREAQFQKEINETKDLTFHPTINPISNHYRTVGSELPEDKLLKKGMKSKDKIEQMRAEVMYSTQQLCSFKPKINDNSRVMAMQKQTYYDYDDVGDEAKPHSRGRVEPDQYIQLYDEAMKRVDRHQNIYSM